MALFCHNLAEIIMHHWYISHINGCKSVLMVWLPERIGMWIPYLHGISLSKKIDVLGLIFWEYIYMNLFHSPTIKCHRQLKCFLVQDKKNLSILHNQYHICWYSGHARSQSINGHDVPFSDNPNPGWDYFHTEHTCLWYGFSQHESSLPRWST